MQEKIQAFRNIKFRNHRELLLTQPNCFAKCFTKKIYSLTFLQDFEMFVIEQYWSGTERIDLNNGPDMYYVVVAYERE